MKLKDALKSILDENEIRHLVGAFDVVGDIAITIIPPELTGREEIIGRTILSLNRAIRVVAKRVGTYSGEHRTISLAVIAGENRTETVHREHGVSLALNPETVYFSVRSGSERKRVADLVSAGEQVLVMFSGVAPYPLVIARHSKAAAITGIESNEIAHAFGRHNLTLNKASDRVRLLSGDVRRIIPQLDTTFDRVIMPLPGTARDFLALALSVLKPGGWLHFYDFQAPDTFEQAVATVHQACIRANRRLDQAEIIVCGHTAPATYRICVDARVG